MTIGEKIRELRRGRDMTQEELASALEKQFESPGFQTLDHLPMYHCDRCLVYCPVGNWAEKFRKTGLSNK